MSISAEREDPGVKHAPPWRNRRLRGLALGALALGATLVIAACGGDDDGDDDGVPVARSGPVAGEVTISNWPGYIDRGTVGEFEDQTGAEVEYIEDINDNAQFFGKLQPQLDRGESGDRSIFVVTDWMARQMFDLGYLQSVDHDDLGTVFQNLNPALESPSLDPQREYSIPWQSGMTGIWVDAEEAPDIRSVNDLFDPKHKGRVTVLTELRDTVPLVMKADGIDPTEASKEDWLAAIDKIKEAADSGQIRRFTGNDYTEDITSGNAVASIGWSGDASLIGNPNAEWRMPTEGCMLWTDNMVIPVGAPNTAAALEWMNFVYRPQVQADIAEFVNYVTPVEGVQEVLADRDPELAENQLIFPDQQFTRSCTTQVNPPGEAADVREVTEAFEEVVSG